MSQAHRATPPWTESLCLRIAVTALDNEHCLERRIDIASQAMPCQEASGISLVARRHQEINFFKKQLETKRQMCPLA
jgi:hypothetical protein